MEIKSKLSCRFNSIIKFYELKADLNIICFSSIFLRFCFLKRYALFCQHFCKSISALRRLQILINILFKKRYFKTELYPFTKYVFGKFLSSMWVVSADIDVQKRGRKKNVLYFFMEIKKRTLCKSIFSKSKLWLSTIFAFRLQDVRYGGSKNGSGLLIPLIHSIPLIHCTDKNSFTVEKIKLNWFDLKFVSKKKRWLLQ